ncbi:MAG TPA: diguanylate cyclase [Deltaproteobacteria bacterium]|nr:diguanylate cyclase [Deltaproteobacteria bacterium]
MGRPVIAVRPSLTTSRSSSVNEHNRPHLSLQEYEILKYIHAGVTNREISRLMGETPYRVARLIRGLKEKMGTSTRSGLVEKGLYYGLIDGRDSDVQQDGKPDTVKLGIVGCGKGGSAILEIFKEDSTIKISWVVDENPMARGIPIARKLGIPVYHDLAEAVTTDVDIIVNVTGSSSVREFIKKMKRPDTELMGGVSARLLWQLVDERQRRMEERQRMLKDHESLYHLGLVIENIDSLNDVGYAIIDYATRLTATPAGSLALFDERNENMVMVVSKGFSAEFQKVDRWDIRRGGLTDKILTQTSPTIIKDLREFPALNPVLLEEGVRSLLAAPLTIEGRIVGIIYVNDFVVRDFKAEVISLFTLLTIYAALTIERVKSIEEMRRLSITDGLTGLYNHRYIMDEINKETKKCSRNERSFSIIMLDIDHFKSYNDTYGHLEGNKVLKALARLLNRTVRSTDTVGRFGGEEFCIIIDDMEKKGAVAFANRLLKEIASYRMPNRRITVSGGVATFPDDGRSPMELIKQADMCLYDAKKAGRNRICS